MRLALSCFNINLRQVAIIDCGVIIADIDEQSKEEIDMAINKKKLTKPPVHQQVVEYMNNLEHPLKREIEEVRKIILDANGNLTEHIKWNAPSFCFNNEDRVTFNLHGKGYFKLVFHRGAKVKDNMGNEPLFEDNTGILDWVAADRATVKFIDMNDVDAKREKLVDVVNKWLKIS